MYTEMNLTTVQNVESVVLGVRMKMWLELRFAKVDNSDNDI